MDACSQLEKVHEGFLEAARENNVEELRKIAHAQIPGFNVNYADPVTGATALHMAAANGHMEALRFLLTGLDSKISFLPNKSGNTPLQWAIQNKMWLAAKELLVKGGEEVYVDRPNEFGKSALSEGLYKCLIDEENNVATETEIQVKELLLQHPTADSCPLPLSEI